MKKQVKKGLGRAIKAVAANSGKAGIAAAGVAVAAGAVVLAKKKLSKRGRNTDGFVAEEDLTGTPDSAEEAMHVPTSGGQQTGGNGSAAPVGSSSMTEAPIPGARFNDVREERKSAR